MNMGSGPHAVLETVAAIVLVIGGACFALLAYRTRPARHGWPVLAAMKAALDATEDAGPDRRTRFLAGIGSRTPRCSRCAARIASWPRWARP